MRRTLQEWPPPPAREHLELVRGGPRGMWWRGGNGLEVRLASADTAPSVERERLSLLAMMVALVVARRPDA